MTVMKYGALLALTCLTVSCQAKESNVSKQIEQFDGHFQKALTAARQLDFIRYKLCPTGEWGDYRYRVCFNDLSGSAAQTMGKLHQLLLNAGFKSTTSYQIGSDLDGSYTIPGTPFTLSATFSSRGIQWMAFQEDRGTIAPRAGFDPPDAKYALMSPAQFVELRAMEFVSYTVPEDAPERPFSRFARACGQTSLAASSCIQPLTLNEIYNALAGLYVSDDRQEFDRLNKQATFTDADSKGVQAMIDKGLLSKGFVNAFTFYKASQDHYYVIDTFDHPGHRLDYFIDKQPGGQYQVKITAARIKKP